MRDYAELVKALRGCCSELRCPDCYLWENGSCKWQMRNDAADAIEELVNEVHNRENDCINLTGECATYYAQIPQWISVEERLPHYLDHVLCVNKYGIQMVGHLTDYKEGGFRCESGMDSCDYITHWMPLPTSPGGAE